MESDDSVVSAEMSAEMSGPVSGSSEAGPPVESPPALDHLALDSHLRRMVDEQVLALDALPDDAMRQHRFAHWLEPLPVDQGLEALELLLEGSRQDRGRYRAVVGSLLPNTSLLLALGPERAEEWKARAVDRQLTAAAVFLGSEPPFRRYYAAQQLDVNEQLEAHPLGVRKSLARRTERQILDRLLYDKHPQVLEILLNNPRLLERDVVKMAALQPTTEHALRAIFSHPRWIRRYSVKKALAFNPYAPLQMAQHLLGFLLAPDLRDASHTRRLSPQVRSRAQQILDERVQGRQALHALHQQSGADQEDSPQAGSALAADFLSSLPDADALLTALEEGRLAEEVFPEGMPSAPCLPEPDQDELDEDMEVDEELAAFLGALPSTLPLVPVGSEE